MTSTPAEEQQAEHLQQVFHNTIPLSKAMNLEVVHLSANCICLKAPVANTNINIHGTAFAGSIYSLCALTAWGFMYNRLLIDKLSADVVVAEAKIRYLRPIKTWIRSEYELDEQKYAEFHQRLLQDGKARFSISVQAQEDQQLQATLDASVAVKLTD